MILSAEIPVSSHRERVGGLWDAVGELQLSFLRLHGLQPHMTLLDVGCGCLRGGVRYARFLEPGNYYGLDRDAELLVAGYEIELPHYGLRDRVPLGNLRQDESFSAGGFGVVFDAAVAISLWTHLAPPAIRACLAGLAPALRPGASLFASYFDCPRERHPVWLQEPGVVLTYSDRDPYHYRFDDLQAFAEGLPWSIRPLGAWGHPRGQSMARFERRAE